MTGGAIRTVWLLFARDESSEQLVGAHTDERTARLHEERLMESGQFERVSREECPIEDDTPGVGPLEEIFVVVEGVYEFSRGAFRDRRHAVERLERQPDGAMVEVKRIRVSS